MAAKDEVGRYGEDVVARVLTEQGWEVLARNWRCPDGELDIIAVDGGDLVAVEVKTRRGSAFGSPQEAVTWRKLHRIRRLIAAWLASQDRSFPGVRVDVVAVTVARAGAATVEHLRGVE
ncbi:YraN family protein [Demequina aurantiaca]|uniref:YraN family protein n=1 Tax=Demequina aurantiaca TaxID=676200 RepID=UPI0007838B52|nr:YraN family protein [Demequina aurantiaca]